MNANVRELPTASLTPHPEAAIVPEMPPDQYKIFIADVKRRGIDKPLEVIPGTRTVIDGRTRLRAAKDAQLATVPVVDADLNGDSPLVYMLRVAYLRRNLKPAQAAKLGNEIKKTLAAEMRQKKREGGKKGGEESGKARRGEEPAKGVATGAHASQPKRQPAARDRAAAMVGSSGRSIDDAAAIEEKAPAVYAQMGTGEIATVAQAKRAAGIATAKPAKSEPAVKVTKPLAHIPGFPAALAAALEMTHIRTDVALSEHANREKGSHEERVRKVLAKAPGTHEKEVATATAAFLDHLYPSRKNRGKRSAEEQLQDLGLLSAPEFLPCPFCGTAGERLAVLGQSGVTCHECGAMGPIKSDATAARNAWNKRAKS